MADPMKYTSVSISNDNWKIATQLQSVVTRGATLSRAKVVEIALARLADELELTKYCCRRHVLTHVDIE